MTREEAIDLIIEEAKSGNDHAHADFCEKYTICTECPLQGNESCRSALFNRSIKRLIKSEEHQETNFEHYFYDMTYKDGKFVIMFEEDMTHKFLYKDESCKFVKWLLKPYEPPKYKLSQFEYDLLDATWENYSFREVSYLKRMTDKGYFQDVDGDVKVRDILDNCEVTD